MLIFTLPGWYKSERYPENCLFIYEQMQAIKEKGHSVVVLSVQPIPIQQGKKPDHRIKKIIDNGIVTYYTEIMSVWPTKFKSIYVNSFSKALGRLINRAINEFGVPDLYYAHFSFAAGFAAVKLKGNVPLVTQEHFSLLMNENIDKKMKHYIKETVRNSDAFICVSQGLLESIEKFVDVDSYNVKVVTNMIDPCFKYYPLKQTDKFVFFSMGGLIKRKGFDLLIKAFSEEFKDDEKVILRIAGQGEEKKNLEECIHNLGIDKRIELIGQIGRERTLEEYTKCNAFVLASRAETYGLVYREAMAVGRPIISTRHGGIRTVPDYAGHLIDVDDFCQLKRALREIYTNYDKYDGKLISEKCLQECSSDSVVEKIISVFDEVTCKANIPSDKLE